VEDAESDSEQESNDAEVGLCGEVDPDWEEGKYRCFTEAVEGGSEAFGLQLFGGTAIASNAVDGVSKPHEADLDCFQALHQKLAVLEQDLTDVKSLDHIRKPLISQLILHHKE